MSGCSDCADGAGFRLVGHEDPQARAAAAVAAENRAAAGALGLDPTDPRWVLAVRAHAQLQGSVLTPERRQRVLATARVLGVRPFDANVVIALVQDRARRGEPLGGLGPILQEMPDPRRHRREGLRLLAAAAVALAATALVIRWLMA